MRTETRYPRGFTGRPQLACGTHLFFTPTSFLLSSPSHLPLFPVLPYTMDDSAHGGAAFADSEGLASKGEKERKRCSSGCGGACRGVVRADAHSYVPLPRVPPRRRNMIMHAFLGAMRSGRALATAVQRAKHKLGQTQQNVLTFAPVFGRQLAPVTSLCCLCWIAGMCRCANLGKKRGSEWARPGWKDGGGASAFRRLTVGCAAAAHHTPDVSFNRTCPFPTPPCSFPTLPSPPDAITLLAEYGRNELAEKKKSKLKILGKLLISPMAIALWIAIIVELGRLGKEGWCWVERQQFFSFSNQPLPPPPPFFLSSARLDRRRLVGRHPVLQCWHRVL